MSQQYLTVESIYKQFGDFNALSDISLSVNKGEFICFLGPSGCGKTTLLRTIAGLETQTSGRIFQDGEDISHLPTEKRDFGIVFQSYALFPNLTVADNITFALRERGMDKAQSEVLMNEWLTNIGLQGSNNKYPSQLSGGQQQRVALARALVLSPGLLLLDEPLSALDAKVRTHLRVEIRKLQKELGITTIMVTHDQEEALSMADRIVVMNQSKIEQIGTPTEIYRHPASEFVARFVGNINFIDQSHPLHHHFNQKQPISSQRYNYAIRPEDIHIELNAKDSICADIVDKEFMGASMRLICDIGNGRTIEVDSPNHLSDTLLKSNCSQVGLRIDPALAHQFVQPGA
ncbi:putative 2-aminoethylphosphonate ABC transporter ATP-binding protein [Vibrio japonicus]|uniref:2-aminoethylphosphonate ABC transporter ATP-binding protein n=1 Tax=Vibrio japonicus TaxID=1824638 RepID=A0ABY5LJW7_9VIBR|nr:putative 2-aminoethylphosphonate ABC transporter ATP-binding protein [Vibrio japonicus]UUM32357.1 putative 2-aminoethylphosphonate ABC transporter ATP-binding protein [Vibrio japonicus]